MSPVRGKHWHWDRNPGQKSTPYGCCSSRGSNRSAGSGDWGPRVRPVVRRWCSRRNTRGHSRCAERWNGCFECTHSKIFAAWNFTTYLVSADQHRLTGERSVGSRALHVKLDTPATGLGEILQQCGIDNVAVSAVQTEHLKRTTKLSRKFTMKKVSNQSINQSTNHLISQTINRINQSLDQSKNQSINRTIDQSNNQSINQSIEESVWRWRPNQPYLSLLRSSNNDFVRVEVIPFQLFLLKIFANPQSTHDAFRAQFYNLLQLEALWDDSLGKPHQKWSYKPP